MRASKGLVALALAGVAMFDVDDVWRRTSARGCSDPTARGQHRGRGAAAGRRRHRARRQGPGVGVVRPAHGRARSRDAAPEPGSRPHPERRSNPGGVRRLSAPPADSPLGRSGIYGLENVPSEMSGTNRSGPPPEHHVVKKGDTLSSVCELYFADPWCWPQLWASNPHVTNPHWIFPGDVLRLRAAPPPRPRPPRLPRACA